MWWVELSVVAGMIAVNSVFAAYELALASVSLARLEQLTGEKKRGAKAAAYMKRNVEGSLAGIQLGITLVAAVAAATGGAGAEEQVAPKFEQWLNVSAGVAEFLALAAVVAPLTLFTIIFGELVPKVFALRNKELVCLALSPPMRVFVFVVWPVVWLLESSVTGLMSLGERLRGKRPGAGDAEHAELQEVRASAALARTSRLIGLREEGIIVGATNLTTRPVGEVMLPADAISLLHADADIDDALVAAHLDMHTRFPVTERPGDPQGVIGYVNVKDIIAHMRHGGGGTVRKVLRDITTFSADTPVSLCLEQLIRGYVHIALVRDAGGAVVGMVTMEDIIEELVGDIGDEYDHLPTHAARSGRGWVVGGGITPERLKTVTGIDLPTTEGEPPARHLSDWVERRNPAPLRGGESVVVDSVRVFVRKVRRHKVLEAQVERLPR